MMNFRAFPMHEAVSAFKRSLVLEALTANGGNRSRAALALKIERTSLLRLIRELGLSDSLPNGRRGRPRSPSKPYGPGENGSAVNVS
jgi:DNA-binding NtrC family response regulator